MQRQYRNRTEAGQLLAERLGAYANRPDVLVLGLARGGVPVAFEVATALHAPLDVMVVRKLGLPGEEELAMGAIGPGGVRVLNQEVVGALLVPPMIIDKVAAEEQRVLEQRQRTYRDDRPAPDLHGRTVILVDDGLATGATMQAAVQAAHRQGATHVVVAVPVGAAASCAELKPQVDRLICLMTPKAFGAVGLWYADFTPTSDNEVRMLLAHGAASAASAE